MLDLLNRDYKRLPLNKIPWAPFIFSLSLIIIFGLSFAQYKWMTDSVSLLMFPIIGGLSGYILGKTRWNGFGCFLYSIFLFIIFASQFTMKIMPSLGQLPYTDWLNQFNWEFNLYLDRIHGWLTQFLLHEEINDPTLYSLALMFELWLPASWFVWIFQRKSKMWLSVFPILVLVIQNVYATQASIALIYAALIVILIYTAIQEYFRKQESWTEKHMDYPDGLWQDWFVAAFLIIAISLVAAHNAPKVATPEGWREIQEWMEEIREASNQDGAVAESNGYVAAGSVYSPSTTVHIVSEPDVNRVGAALPDQNQLVMWVRVADPTPRNWRTAVYSTYTGTGWVEADYGSPIDSLADEDLEQKLGQKYIRQTFSLKGDYGDQLFAAGDPVQVNKQQVLILPVYPDGSLILRGNVTRYEVVSQVPNVGEEHLRSSSGMMPQWIDETYLQLPDTIPPRVRELSLKLVAEQETQLDQVIAIQNYLRESVPYDLNTPVPAEGQDVVDYFLFEAPSGFCTYYATSMVIMLREAGIPARLVTGYASGRYILEQGLFQVWGDQAHAWVEVYFPQYGWIPFEPTPNQEVPNYARATAHVNLPLMMNQQAARRNLFFLRVGTVLLMLLVAAVVVFTIAHLWQRKRMISRHSKHPYIRLYFRIRYRLQTFGYEIQPDQTAWEFWHAVEKQLQVYPNIHAALLIATRGVEKTIYSPYGMSNEDITTLRIAIRITWMEWIQMGWKHFIRRTTKFFASLKKKGLHNI